LQRDAGRPPRESVGWTPTCRLKDGPSDGTDVTAATGRWTCGDACALGDGRLLRPDPPREI